MKSLLAVNDAHLRELLEVHAEIRDELAAEVSELIFDLVEPGDYFDLDRVLGLFAGKVNDRELVLAALALLERRKVLVGYDDGERHRWHFDQVVARSA